MNKLNLVLFILLLLSFTITQAKPRWIKSMDDSKANYFKAVKSFDRYWKKHLLPNEEEENPKEKERQIKDPRPWIVKIFQSKERAQEKSNELLIQYKNFNKWKFEMLPYVKSDGSIMSTEERLDAWKKLQNQ